MSKVDLISPVDGSVYLSREYVSEAAARAAIEAARAAQPEWAARPLAERIEMVKKAVAIIDG